MFDMSFLSGIFEDEERPLLQEQHQPHQHDFHQDEEVVSITSEVSEEEQHEEFATIPLARSKKTKRQDRKRAADLARQQRQRDLQIKIACQSIKRHVVDNISSTRRARTTPVSPDDIDGILNDLVWEEFRSECSLRSTRRQYSF